MMMKLNINKRLQVVPAFGLLLTVLGGIAFYLSVRGYVMNPALPVPGRFGVHITQGVVLNSMPSMIHSAALAFFAILLGLPTLQAVIAASVFEAAWELAQYILPSLGVADMMDVVFGCIGALGAGIFMCLSVKREATIEFTAVMRILFVVSGGLSSIATSPPPPNRPVLDPSKCYQKVNPSQQSPDFGWNSPARPEPPQDLVVKSSVNYFVVMSPMGDFEITDRRLVQHSPGNPRTVTAPDATNFLIVDDEIVVETIRGLMVIDLTVAGDLSAKQVPVDNGSKENLPLPPPTDPSCKTK